MRRIGFLDVSRAHFWALCTKRILIELPPEHPDSATCYGLLLRSMYGLRTASHDWSLEVRRVMLLLGFREGRASSCSFYHEEKELRVSVHGDDFSCLGYPEDIKWLWSELNKYWIVKIRGILGEEGVDEIDILNRTLRISADGSLELEADTRHVKIALEHLGLTSVSKSLVSPVCKKSDQELLVELGEEKELGREEVTLYRSVCMRLAYLKPIGRCVKRWSVTQSCIAVSTSESEFYALLKGAACVLGLQFFYADFGINISC